MEVGVAEAVDRLLRIADEEHRRVAAAVDRLEDRELQRIGVLELVDQRRGILRAQAVGQSGMRVALRARRGGCAADRRSRRRARRACACGPRRRVLDEAADQRETRAGQVASQRAPGVEQRARRRQRTDAPASCCPCSCISTSRARRQQIELVVLRVGRERIARAKPVRPSRRSALAIDSVVVDVAAAAFRARSCANSFGDRRPLRVPTARARRDSSRASAVVVWPALRRVRAGKRSRASGFAVRRATIARERFRRIAPVDQVRRERRRARARRDVPAPEVVDDVLRESRCRRSGARPRTAGRPRTACRRARGSRSRGS